MITARSADEPVAISVDVSMMGCVMLKDAPGMWLLSRCDSSRTRSRLVFPEGQFEYGVRLD